MPEANYIVYNNTTHVHTQLIHTEVRTSGLPASLHSPSPSTNQVHTPVLFVLWRWVTGSPHFFVSYRSHHASNPPKHRVHGGVARAGGVASNPSTKPHRKKDLRGAGEVKGQGGSGGEIRGVGITTLHPPPASKQSVPRATPSPVPQPHVQSGGTTYFYSGRQVFPPA